MRSSSRVALAWVTLLLLLWPAGAGAAPAPRVRFEGNRDIATARLDALVAEIGPNLGVADVVTRLCEAVVAFYDDEGYVDARVDRRGVAADGIEVLAVSEGPRYTLGTIGFTGDWQLPAAELERATLSRSRAPVSRTTLMRDRDHLQALSGRAVWLETRIASKARIVDVIFRAD